MLVKVAISLRNTEEFSIEASDLRSILNYLKYLKGPEYTKAIMDGNFKYVLMDSKNQIEPIGLLPEVLLSDFGDYDTLCIIHEVCGEGTAILLAIGAAAYLGGAAFSIVAAVINIVISIAVSFIMSLLSPTPEFSSDPSLAVNNKQSSLFKGAPLIREQGGSVPIIFGNPFCGGVLISSGVSTEDVI